MTNQLTTTTTNPAPEVARLRTRVASLHASIVREGGVDKLPTLLDPTSRKELDGRRRSLHAQLRPISLARAEQDAVQAAILTLLGMYPNIRIVDREGTSRAYMASLRDQPLFAIMAGLDDFRNGRVYDLDREGERIPFTLDHAPSAPRILDQVKKRAANVQEEHARIGRILAITKTTDDPGISAEEQARVAAKLADLSPTMGRMMTAIRDQDRRRIGAEAQVARDRAQRIIQDAKRRNQELDAASQDAQGTG